MSGFVLADFAPGDAVTAWSERMFGVPVRFEIDAVGRKYLTGRFVHPRGTWKGALHPARVVEVLS